jgi:phenylacetic acid degradation operon negative regulatory protein
MAKLMRISDYLFLSLAVAGDILDFVGSGGGVKTAALDSVYGYSSARHGRRGLINSVSRNLKTGDIVKKIDKDGKAYIELTSKGNDCFKRKFPILSLKHNNWDGNFMIVTFDIPEKQRKDRDLVRDKLVELGFGMLQKSVWISAYHFEEDLKEAVSTYCLGDMVNVFSAKSIFSENIKSSVEKIWKVDEIRNMYRNIISEIADKKKKNEPMVFGNYWEKYIWTLTLDPMVPDDLLNSSIMRKEAYNIVLSLKQ